MSIRLSALAERLRTSLFFVPMVLVIAGGAAGVAMTAFDASIGDDADGLPFVLTSTVDSARDVLGVVAAATISFAGIAFSVSLLVIQQASSQFSPRVVHALFRDPFNRRVMGLAVGTFAYCLMVLRAVRGPLEESGEPVIPNLSVTLAVLLGILAILAIVAFIDHNAHSLEISQILSRVAADTVTQIERNFGDDEARAGSAHLPAGAGHAVLLHESGWIQQIDHRGLLHLVPEGGTVALHTTVGRYAIAGTALCSIWPAPHDEDELHDRVASSVDIGVSRTTRQDPGYGIRQLVDVALIALSPGVNDPTTAQDAIFHLAEVLREALVRSLPLDVVQDEHGRRLIRSEMATHDSLIELTFDEIRQTSAAMPAVCTYLLEALRLLDEAVGRAGHPERGVALRRQAELILAGARRADLLPPDLDIVENAYRRRFDDGDGGTRRAPLDDR